MDLHVFFLPMTAMGHLIPMLQLAHLFSSRRGVRATVVAPAAAIPLIQPTLRHHPIQLLPLGDSDADALPLVTHPQNNKFTPEMGAAILRLEAPFVQLLRDHCPDCIVADLHYSWASSVAEEQGIPRLQFTGCGCFATVLLATIGLQSKLILPDHDDRRPFLIPGLPKEIHLTTSQLPEFVTHPTEILRFADSAQCFGMVINTFDDLEREYILHAKKYSGMKIWCLGPFSLSQPEVVASNCSDELMRWLDSKKQRYSVLYLCFGSLGLLPTTQLREIALGLQASRVDFVWVVRDAGDSAERLPEGFNERVMSSGKGMILKDWVPQRLILNNEAVGGFVTHCGWNSCLEAVAAGVPMVTWPLHSEQFLNEKLLVEELRIGVPVGATVCSLKGDERILVKAEAITRTVGEVMGSGEEVQARRERVATLREMAAKAVAEGGTSYLDMDNLLDDLISLKAGRRLARHEPVQ
ncbi:hypothetical protein ZIOFF_018974 [Zingiber officinale]|uniref:Glycosyltransferase n=2 Tax=Zingiber officinale TaxID=94328 RepID=A0A8J5HXD3_ZINOF|nr:hypothetical protein ZIOFF_018974 [Zingiber officinale]